MHDTLDYKIPLIDRGQYEGAFGPVPYDATDPRAREPLILLDTVGVAYGSHHARSDGGNWPYHRPLAGSRKDIWLREGAAIALVAANRQLRRFGVELFVLDGYRNLQCQQAIFDFYVDQGRAVLADPTDHACWRYALTFATETSQFSLGNAESWPSHSTGGAVDLTLRSLDTGDLVDMGSRYEEMTETSHNDYFERQVLAGEVSDDDPRLRHRRLLHWAMENEGWINSPWVFWHYDLGTRMYIQVSRARRRAAPAAAWYGYMPVPVPVSDRL
jgi:D-alanyl-D-alanine dipeptidase